MIWVNVLIGLTTVLLVVGVFSVFANRLLFNPDNWSSTSTQLLDNANVRSTTANYVIDQLYANVDVPALLKSGLPPQFQSLAAPAAGALRNAAVQGVELALTRPRVQQLWATANRAADQTLIAVVNGGKGAVGVNNGAVSLNLGPIVDNVASRLGLPANLGAKLPANIANLTVFKAKQLKVVQNVGNAIKSLALWLTILVPLLYALAVFLARGHRRRTLMNVGLAAVVGGVLVILGRSVLQTQVTNSLTTDASLKATINDVIGISTAIIHQIAAACIIVGIVLIVAAWFAGPASVVRGIRRNMAPFLRERPAESYGITLAVMGVIFIWQPIHATGTPAGIVVFTVLALLGMHVLRRQTAEEFPDARPGDATRRMRARIASIRRRGQSPTGSSASASVGLPEQLRGLADLRERGAITADEYETAKARLLAL